MSNNFSINGRTFGRYNPYLIAEIGVNHEGSTTRASRMIEAAARAGAHAVKFQSYRAETLASPRHSDAYWDLSSEPTKSQFELFRKYPSFSFDDYAVLAEKARSAGVDFLSTPFDAEIAEMLNPLVPAFKIASADLTNAPLIKQLMGYGKPLIVSTGAASVQEITDAIQLLSTHEEPVAILHCVLNYPTNAHDANLLMIERLQMMTGSKFSVGYSDHVPPALHGRLPQLELAFSLGATVIEKHFTDDRKAPGNDHYHAASETELLGFTDWISEAKSMLGSGRPELELQESARANARRRIFAATDLKSGTILEEHHLMGLRSTVGTPVTEWEEFVGRTLVEGCKAGDPLFTHHLEN